MTTFLVARSSLTLPCVFCELKISSASIQDHMLVWNGISGMLIGHELTECATRTAVVVYDVPVLPGTLPAKRCTYAWRYFGHLNC